MKLDELWYTDSRLTWFLAPLTGIFAGISSLRRYLYVKGIKPSRKPAVPTIVVGNISVGGTGKTPLVVWLCQELRKAGYKPGIISRGYGSKAPAYPYVVDQHSPVEHSGDEPYLLQQATRCPLVISPVRTDAADHLLANFDVDVIVTDDGLQHYALQRDIEIIVIDAKRRLGNGHLLPMGPLREGAWRLKTADFVICNGGHGQPDEISMHLKPAALRAVSDNRPVEHCVEGPMVAIAGIGNPQRFYNTLQENHFTIEDKLSFPDHHAFTEQELINFAKGRDLVMTEKDAVKCQSFAKENWYYLPVIANLDEQFLPQLLLKLKDLTDDIGS